MQLNLNESMEMEFGEVLKKAKTGSRREDSLPHRVCPDDSLIYNRMA